MMVKIMAAVTLALFASGCSARSEPAHVPEAKPVAVDLKSLDAPPKQMSTAPTSTEEPRID